MITIFVALPVVCSAVFGAMALLGSNPWAMVLALPVVVVGCWVIA